MTDHIPVLLAEVIEVLAPKDGGIYVDGTFGAGGYSKAILDAADCAVIGIDRDPNAIRDGQGLVEAYGGRLTLLQGCFGDMADLLEAHGSREVDGVVLDIGVSSMQLDQAERGFSFSKPGPLDMRMSQEGQSAADVVNEADEQTLMRIFQVYGEEKRARAIAKAIVTDRAANPFRTTQELAELIERVVGRKAKDRIHPATRAFQGLRIFINDELGELIRALEGAEHVLRPSGRLAVVSFHSLEDRLVKRFLAERSGAARSVSRHAPGPVEGPAPTFELLTRKALRAGERELDVNNRARSARLRAAVRTEAPAWPVTSDAAALGVRMI
ncbi:MAG: 16S rRNA (cytosine(1402)-N(4))-methyltransferase RsmH [Alphaproteobacteria bacterium]|nr:MAG: 16S rRNA (cytosine(1402)-N(4))-methyltransferase RsmH [Alphaproteobacteria bacterium]